MHTADDSYPLYRSNEFPSTSASALQTGLDEGFCIQQHRDSGGSFVARSTSIDAASQPAENKMMAHRIAGFSRADQNHET